MQRTTQTVIILCLISTYWCNGGKSESDVIKEKVQDRPTTALPSPTPDKSSTYSKGLDRSSSAHSVLADAMTAQSASYDPVVGAGEHCNDDVACLTLASQDRIGLEAIRTLHRQLDDDANGNVDLSESDEFLREELKYEQGYERRQQAFHLNDDGHISVRELWEAWIRSEVHNWTVEQTTEWLASNVELPQYIPIFIRHRVTGASLPRLAVNNMYYLNNILGIKDPIHKQKIALKAMDVVLFGAPKDYNNYMKDLVLVTLLLGALVSCWYAYYQNKNSRRHLHRMMKDMEGLHKAEQALDHLQKELERARMEQESVATEKQNLERRLLEQGNDQLELRTSYSDLEVSQLKAEIELLRGELQRAEVELEDRCWAPPTGLQQWLQLTHEIENKAYVKKKIAAEKQLQQAREACEKLRKKRSSLVGAFVSTHGKSIDEVDRSIVEARTSLNEVTTELQERVHRWKQIEQLCGFNLINNSGLQYLETVLYRNNGRGIGLRGRISSSQDDLDDDNSSVYTPSAALESLLWKGEPADSSGSETGKPDQDDDAKTETRSLAGNVHFTVGGDSSSWSAEDVANKDKKKTNGAMVRSYSQDMHREPTPPHLSQSLSETFLDGPSTRTSHGHSSVRKPIPEKPSLEDEVYSTDSNSTVDAEELRRKKRKLFPFSRKSKTKVNQA